MVGAATQRTVDQGSILELQCSAEGEPKPDIVWHKEDGPLPAAAESNEVSRLFRL